jgi:DNA-binding transcriptional regulator YhcF (GntR family)
LEIEIELDGELIGLQIIQINKSWQNLKSKGFLKSKESFKKVRKNLKSKESKDKKVTLLELKVSSLITFKKIVGIFFNLVDL